LLSVAQGGIELLAAGLLQQHDAGYDHAQCSKRANRSLCIFFVAHKETQQEVDAKCVVERAQLVDEGGGRVPEQNDVEGGDASPQNERLVHSVQAGIEQALA
jgi:hypothetical protein